MIAKDAVWLITGCSKGLGRALAEAALRAGDRVVMTARDPSALTGLAETYPGAALVETLDVTDPAQGSAVVASAEAKFGGVDVLVNNAGYGYVAAIEEGEEADVRALFETNVFGVWNMLRAALPGMRSRGRGHVVNISSVGGIITFPAVGFYHMTKFALEGLSETLAQELAPFGIGVTVVEPGAFRTDFRGASMKQSAVRIAAYADTAGKARDGVLNGHGQQRGDPERGALAILEAARSAQPPLHLVLGDDALVLIRRKLAQFAHELEDWEAVTKRTDFR